MITVEEVDKKLKILKAQLKQVSAFHIPENKKSTSAEPGISNVVLVGWKENRISEIEKEVEDLRNVKESFQT